MWIIFAFGSALFAGLTSILAKCGIKNTDTNVATAHRNNNVLIFTRIIKKITKSQSTLYNINTKTLISKRIY